MNKNQTMGFWRSFYLNIFLIGITLISGNSSLFAEEKSSLIEEESSRQKLSLTTENITQPAMQNTSSQTEEEPLDFSDTGRSGQQTAGETRRGQCADVSFPVTALVPSSNFGKTTATHPQLWFYIPYSTKDISKVEFVIQDGDRNDITRQSWQPQNIPGYLSASLPETQFALETSKSYRWYFKVYCQEEGNTAPLFVQGWIEKTKVSDDLSQQAVPEQAPHMIYAHNNLWFDAIDSLLTLLNSQAIAPINSEILADWEDLIKAQGVNLELPELGASNLLVRYE